jgi:hypothetical protein
VAGLLNVGAERSAQNAAQTVPVPACGAAIRFAGEPDARPAVYPVIFTDTETAGLPILPKFLLREPAVYVTVFQLRSWALDRIKIQTKIAAGSIIFFFIKY